MPGDAIRSNAFRHRADAVRSIPLESVLTQWGAERARRDRSQWRTERGPLSITGSQFFNWHLHQGGGGAIDLVLHLSGWDVGAAVQWLEQQLGSSPSAAPGRAVRDSPASTRACSSHAVTAKHRELRLPASHLAHLQRVRRYLTEQRGLAASILAPLIESGKLYADRRGNAVFLMVAGKANRPIGAELRGTGDQVWRGLAAGTKRDAGYFWVGAVGSDEIVLCESAIDAISCLQQRPDRICISTAGVRWSPAWLNPLLARNYKIYCGFDDDEPGNAASQKMISQHPVIQRLRPPAHDWNDALTSSR